MTTLQVTKQTQDERDGVSRMLNSKRTEMKRKITVYGTYDRTHMVDLISIFAANIEDAYMQCGIEDYTAEQCFTHALQLLVLYPAHRGDITIEWLKHEFRDAK